MPIYEYRCEDGHDFEVIQGMTDDPITACEVCGKPVQRIFHPIAVHFKGSGFYTTDYGKGKKAAAAEGKAESKDGKGDGKDSKKDSSDSKDLKKEPAKTSSSSSSSSDSGSSSGSGSKDQ